MSSEDCSTQISTGTRSKQRKTFTGCWTCRDRHVKCDEQRPACKRCVAGNFPCSGYGVRLTWVSSSDKSSRPKAPRRPGPQRRQRGPPIDSTLSQDTSSRDQTAGNFLPVQGSFQGIQGSCIGTSLNGVRSEDRIAISGHSPSSTSGSSSLDTDILIGNDISLAASDYSSQDLSRPLTCSSEFSFTGHPDGDTDLEVSGLETGWPLMYETEGWEGMTSTSLVSKFPTSDPSMISAMPNDLALFAATTDTQLPPLYDIRLPTRHLDTLSNPSRQRHLINHWVTQLCEKLIPVRNITNPFLSVVSPMALEGSRMAGDKSSNTVALFHAVCAASASHQANIKGGSSESSNLALEHTRLSFYHLSRNIQSNNTNERLAALATLCVWLLAHFINGTPGAWRELVKIARDLLEQTPAETWTESLSASLTYQCYVGFIPLIQSQYIGRLEYPSPIPTNLVENDLIKNQAISHESLDLISSYNTRLLQGDLIDPDELDRLEIEFTLSMPSLSDELNMNTENGAIIHHHSYLFYYACILYFKCTSGRRDPEDEIQNLVEKCMDHIEHLNSIQKGANSRTWIYATVAFEAKDQGLRKRVKEAFAHRRKLGFATFDTILLAAQEIWRRRDAGAAVEPWPKILAELPQFDVPWY